MLLGIFLIDLLHR